jgi:uncharacterized protein
MSLRSLISTTGLLALAALALILYRQTTPQVEPKQITLPADGAEHPALQLRTQLRQTAGPTLRILDNQGLLISPVNPGHTQIVLHGRGRTLEIPVTFVFDPSDSYGDGTPDFLRLHTRQDQEAFRTWFVAIAEAQADRSPIPKEIQDCAALLRFAYRESLRSHDEAWLATYPGLAELSSVHQYDYPHTPLGANLFRVRPGSFEQADLGNGAFAQFADARTLMEHNTYLLGRDIRRAQPGDLLFYRQLDQQSPYDVPGGQRYHSPFHSMIVCGDRSVVYHTGPIHQGKGEMRRLQLTDLLHHPDVRWRPVQENDNFLGVYRWNILR